MTRANDMRELFARWKDSGMSLMAFGKQEGVSYAKLLYWRQKLEPGLTRSRQVVVESEPELVPVEVVADRVTTVTPPTKFEVWFANGVSVDVAAGFDEAELRRLVVLLQSC